MESRKEAFARLLEIIDELRSQCPWDRKQTMESLRNLTIEETYELADSILDKDMKGIREELGDLLLHIVFYAKIAEEKRAFDIEEVIQRVCEKLVVRHPHIYGDVEVQNEEDVMRNWEMIKKTEGKSSVLAGVPGSLPAMIKAYRIQEKAAQVGFEWEKKEQVWNKVLEELEELQKAQESTANDGSVEEEFGDVLFSLINYARYIGVDPETALEKINRKFIQRFSHIEAHADKDLQHMTLEEMDALWEEAKR